VRAEVTEAHLARTAFVYVRQSTPMQVRCNPESRRMQYALEEKARAWGFARVEVVDEDLGRSASGAAVRRGFERVVAAVELGEAGALFCLEASRLARNNREWHHLLHHCERNDTLIVDGDGVYSPRTIDGKLVLGLKGAISELELGLIRRRSQGAIDARVRRGEFILTLPPGYVKLDGRCVKHPDERVRGAISLAFRKFEEFGSVRQTALWLRHEGIELPVKKCGAGGWTTAWRTPSYDGLRRMLTHPVYAGAYAFGINVKVAGSWAGGARPLVRRSQRPEDWKRLILGRHEGYIGWDRYRKNVELIEANGKLRGGGRMTAGKCLLSTMLRCGRCGRTLRAQTDSRRRPPYQRYYCVGKHDESGGARCMGFSGPRIEEAVVSALAEALAEGLREAALRAPVEAELRLDERRRLALLALEGARRDESRCASRREAAEPQTPGVVQELDRLWEAAIRSKRDRERRIEELDEEARALDRGYRSRLEAAAADFRAVWEDPRIDHALRREAIRAILEDIVVDWEDGSPTLTVLLHWRGGLKSALVLRKYHRGAKRGELAGELADLVAELSQTCPPSRVAGLLNQGGRRTAGGLPWTQARVTEILRRYGRPAHGSEENVAHRRGTMTLEKSASHLGVSFMAAHRLARNGLLPASQAVPGAPWLVRTAELDSAVVRREVARIKGRRRGFGGGASEGQLDLGFG